MTVLESLTRRRSTAWVPQKEQTKKENKTCNTGYSLVVTEPTTNPAVTSLTMGERTGSRVFLCIWSHVFVQGEYRVDICL